MIWLSILALKFVIVAMLAVFEKLQARSGEYNEFEDEAEGEEQLSA